MKSAHAKYFQKLVRCNSCLGPLITSPPQITVFTLDVIHSLSTGTYNYKFYANYWSLYKIQVLSWHVQWHYLYFNNAFFWKKTSLMLYLCYAHFWNLSLFMHISGICHYLSQFSFFCACPKTRTFISKAISNFY